MKGLYIASQKPLELDGIPIIDKGQIGAFVPEMITVTFVLDGVTYTYDVPKESIVDGKNRYLFSNADIDILIFWSNGTNQWLIELNSNLGLSDYINLTDSELPIFDTWTFDSGDFELDSLVTSAFEIKRGYEWTFNASGTVYGFDVNAGDVIRALIDNPTDATGWNIECNQFGGGIDPTDYYTKTETDSLLDAKQDTLTSTNFGTFSNGLTAKTTPVDADTINISDSADSNKAKKLSLTNLKAFLKTYFDTIYTTTSAVATQITTALSGYVPTTRTINGQDLSANRVLSFFPLFCVKNIANATTGGTARYTSFQDSTNVGTTQSTNTNVIPIDTTFYNFYIETSNAQPATGSCVLTIQKNGVDTGIVVTIPAGSAAGKFYDNSNSAAFSAGDSLGIKWVNNASASSCTVVSMSIASK